MTPIHVFVKFIVNKLQIYYDLGAYKLYRELTAEAAEYFTSCKTLYDEMKSTEIDSSVDGFCEIKEEILKGFCHACGVSLDSNENLVLKFYSSIRKNYAVSIVTN